MIADVAQQVEHVEIGLYLALAMLFFVITLLGFVLEGLRKDRKERHEREEAERAEQGGEG